MSEHKQHEKYAGPKGADKPPTHAESLGALPGMPQDVAEKYAETGKTPLNHPAVRGSLKDAKSRAAAGFKEDEVIEDANDLGERQNAELQARAEKTAEQSARLVPSGSGKGENVVQKAK
jgi:hypothetical protein